MLADSADYPITVAEIVTSLRKDPILVESAMGSGHTAEVTRRLTALAHQLPYPVYVALVTQPHDISATDDPSEDLAAALHTQLGKGLYIVVTSKSSGLAAAPYGVALPGDFENWAASNDERISMEMAKRHGDAELPTTAGIAAETSLETALRPIPDYHGTAYLLPQTLSDAELDQLFAEQAEADREKDAFRDSNDSSNARIIASTAVGAGLLVGIPFLVWRWRRQRRQLAAVRQSRAKARGLTTYRLTPDAVADVRRQAADELVALAEELRDLPSPPRHPEPAQQAVLAQDAAETLHRADGVAETVGSLVLARSARRDVTRAKRSTRAAYRPCFFDPLHDESSADVHWRYGEGDVTVPACRECSVAITGGGVIHALALDGDRPYFERDDVWARTGFGSLTEELAQQVMADRSTR